MQLYERSLTNQTNGFNQNTDRGLSIPTDFPISPQSGNPISDTLTRLIKVIVYGSSLKSW